MINLKRICILISVLFVSACSYFDTGDTIEVTSEGLEEVAPAVDEYDVGNIVYRETEGSVQVFDLDKSPADAEAAFVELDRPAEVDSNGLVMNPSVEIYPIDIPMQKTLKP